jgi:hypothetical protein
VYLTQSLIADDPYMRLRVASCAAQEGCTDVGLHPASGRLIGGVSGPRATGWDAAWESAQAADVTEPGSDPTVITDAQILSQVQAMMPFTTVADHKPEPTNYWETP